MHLFSIASILNSIVLCYWRINSIAKLISQHASIRDLYQELRNSFREIFPEVDKHQSSSNHPDVRSFLIKADNPFLIDVKDLSHSIAHRHHFVLRGETKVVIATRYVRIYIYVCILRPHTSHSTYFAYFEEQLTFLVVIYDVARYQLRFNWSDENVSLFPRRKISEAYYALITARKRFER